MPLKGDISFDPPLQKAKPLGRSLGFLVSGERETPKLKKSIEEGWKLSVAEVDLETLSSQKSLRQGFAAGFGLR